MDWLIHLEARLERMRVRHSSRIIRSVYKCGSMHAMLGLKTARVHEHVSTSVFHVHKIIRLASTTLAKSMLSVAVFTHKYMRSCNAHPPA